MAAKKKAKKPAKKAKKVAKKPAKKAKKKAEKPLAGAKPKDAELKDELSGLEAKAAKKK